MPRHTLYYDAFDNKQGLVVQAGCRLVTHLFDCLAFFSTGNAFAWQYYYHWDPLYPQALSYSCATVITCCHMHVIEHSNIMLLCLWLRTSRKKDGSVQACAVWPPLLLILQVEDG
jgi:hypothetical protein